jgi:hypothetical protein
MAGSISGISLVANRRRGERPANRPHSRYTECRVARLESAGYDRFSRVDEAAGRWASDGSDGRDERAGQRTVTGVSALAFPPRRSGSSAWG